ncbi:MAG: polysaccharide deacetylase family protein [Gammaproteobacteria bacterium]|nr:polysaccharide deacetylase family protein [Gammaproteobacteria bacterium]
MTRAVPVLMYHHVSPQPGLVTVSPEIFEEHMAYLARKKYRALAADELLEFLQGKRALDGRQVLITFDDGYLDNYVYAYPLLKRYGLKATIFAITGLIGDGVARAHLGADKILPATPDHRACKAAIAAGRADEVMLRWSEIEAMQASGALEIHSHTHTHQRWDQLHADKNQRLAALQKDLTASQAALTTRLGKASQHLCWPWGYFETEYQTIAAQLGFSAQYATAKGINTVGADTRQIPRIVMKEKPAAWLGTRLWIYSHPLAGRLYSRWRK